MMNKDLQNTLDKAKDLSDMDKLTLVDELLAQLDQPDPEIDRIWIEEARKRWELFREGRIKSTPYSEVMEKYTLSFHGRESA